jgi:hypothetical protein
MTETFADGSTRHVAYEDVPSDDPYVRLRQQIVGEDVPSEILTTFAPSPVRPRTYPPGLPFLAGRESHTTESPNGTRSEDVRWRCTDPDELHRALTETLIADGWVATSVAAFPWLRHRTGDEAFVRGHRLVVISRHDFEGGGIIDAADLDQDLLENG